MENSEGSIQVLLKKKKKIGEKKTPHRKVQLIKMQLIQQKGKIYDICKSIDGVTE